MKQGNSIFMHSGVSFVSSHLRNLILTLRFVYGKIEATKMHSSNKGLDKFQKQVAYHPNPIYYTAAYWQEERVEQKEAHARAWKLEKKNNPWTREWNAQERRVPEFRFPPSTLFIRATSTDYNSLRDLYALFLYKTPNAWHRHSHLTMHPDSWKIVFDVVIFTLNKRSCPRLICSEERWPLTWKGIRWYDREIPRLET